MKYTLQNHQHYKIYLLVIFTLLLKFSLLPFAQTVNADAVSRIYASINWMKNPIWITNSVWAPFHFYINGFGLLIWNNPIITPKIINIFFSSFTLVPFYFFTKREFNKDGAFIATIFLAISPILFHNSFLALSETPYLFFLVLTINLLSKGLRENSNLYILLSGLSITIASGIRYEAWIIIGIFGLTICLLKRWKFFFLFSVTASLFPFYWLFTSWLGTGNPLFGIEGTYHWALEVMGNNDNLDFESYLRRIWYFPFSWVIAIGIPVAFIILKTIYKSFTKKSLNKLYVLYSLPFFIMFLFFQYNAFKGVLLLQHRYVGTLVILSLPFIAAYFNELTPKKIKLAVLFGSLTILLSFVYNTSGVIPLPRLEDQSGVEISQLIKNNTNEKSCLILDFVGWDNTYFIALNSEIPQECMVITEGAKNSEVNYQETNNKIDCFENGIILLKIDSELYHHLMDNHFIIDNYQLNTVEIFRNEQVILLKWVSKTELNSHY